MTDDNSFLVVGDEHLEHVMLNKSELRQDLFDLYERAIQKAIELKVKYFISAGDLLDTNKPLAHTIEYIIDWNDTLKAHGITPLAIAGDHSKAINDTTWEDICGFRYVPDVEDTFAGVDYSDNPEEVKVALLLQLEAKREKVQFIFLHGQVPELFGYCEDKKLLDIDWEILKKDYPTLKGAILSDIHNGAFKNYPDFFLGYTGSLGVTRLDEIREKRYIHWDGSKLNFIPYPLIRNFHKFELTKESFAEIEKDKQAFVKREVDELTDSLSKTGREPVYIIYYDKAMFNQLTELAFLYDHAIVYTTTLKRGKEEAIHVNIRSEVKDTSNLCDVFKATLVDAGTYDEKTYQLGVQLLDSLVDGNTKDILNKFKQEYICS